MFILNKIFVHVYLDVYLDIIASLLISQLGLCQNQKAYHAYIPKISKNQPWLGGPH